MTAAPRPPAKKPKRDKPVLEDVPEDGYPGNSKFARALGSVDYQTREKGLLALKSFLVRKSELKEQDMMKIWKGLFYCFWHSDKAPVQAELAERLAAMLTHLSEESAFLFFTCFMATMRREWFGIDRLRLDKFLMLVRKFINKMLACLKAAKWRPDLLQRYTDYLHQHVVSPGDTVPAAGLAYHCGDVLLDELRLVADGQPVPGEAVVAVLGPFAGALQSGEQVVLNRIGEGLFDTLLSELGSPTDDSPYLQQLDTAALAVKLFDMGAAPSTRARNRQVLYDLSGSLERMQRKRQRIEAGGQAGPSSANEPAAKVKKSSKKAPADQAHAASATGTEPQANGAGAVAADAAVPRPGKRKAVEVEAPAHVQLTAEDAQQEDEQLQKQKLKALKKKAVRQLREQQEQLQEGPGPSPAQQPGTASKTPGSSAIAKHTLRNGAGHGEPTSGQKAALRATIAKVGQLGDLNPAKATPQRAIVTPPLTPADGNSKKTAKAEKKAAAAADAATISPAPLTPAESSGKKAARAANAAETPLAANGHPAAATTPATAGKASALGKRSAPGTAAKAAAQVGPQVEAQANNLTARKTPAQVGGGVLRKTAVTTAKKGRVVINLKKNLYFEHGGPIPDPDVRTPPPARAKGGILKNAAQTCPPKVAVLHTVAGGVAKRKQQTQNQQPARVLPKTARRASAALFF